MPEVRIDSFQREIEAREADREQEPKIAEAANRLAAGCPTASEQTREKISGAFTRYARGVRDREKSGAVKRNTFVLVTAADDKKTGG